ncbi:hypothetical protein BDZ97DRAFT_1758783 [Flammula alnicola]|nr:hypothetical protein BDZ97DRAFT_1758783 [Flammula alnicola]
MSPILEKKPTKKWSSKETNMLLQGCLLHGVGNWRAILEDPDLKFHESRSVADLNHRLRTSYPEVYKLHDPNAQDIPSTLPSPISPLQDLLPSALRDDDEDDLIVYVAPYPRKTSSHNGEEVAVESEENPSTEKTRNKRRQPFTEVEDRALKAGYEKHGTSWASHVKDPVLREPNGRSTELRDRFRQAFRDLYKAAGYKLRTVESTSVPVDDVSMGVRLLNRPSTGTTSSSSSSPRFSPTTAGTLITDADEYDMELLELSEKHVVPVPGPSRTAIDTHSCTETFDIFHKYPAEPSPGNQNNAKEESLQNKHLLLRQKLKHLRHDMEILTKLPAIRESREKASRKFTLEEWDAITTLRQLELFPADEKGRISTALSLASRSDMILEPAAPNTPQSTSSLWSSNDVGKANYTSDCIIFPLPLESLVVVVRVVNFSPGSRSESTEFPFAFPPPPTPQRPRNLPSWQHRRSLSPSTGPEISSAADSVSASADRDATVRRNKRSPDEETQVSLATKGITDSPLKSLLGPPKLPPSAWQLYFTDWIQKQQVSGTRKLNVAQAAKEAGQEYARLSAAEKEPYKQRSQAMKEAREKEHEAYMRTLSPEDIKRENLFRTAQRKAGKSRKSNIKDPNAPKKPLSAYFMFLQRIRANPRLVSEIFGDEIETTKQSILAAAKWRSMTDAERQATEREKMEYEAARRLYEEGTPGFGSSINFSIPPDSPHFPMAKMESESESEGFTIYH